MNDILKIKISIADRVYPLKTSPEKEQGIRAAANKISDFIKDIESNYAVRDKQDVLAMCALHFASNVEQKDISSNQDYTEIAKIIQKINSEIKNTL